MLAVAMPENPTYRVTGEDWDRPEQQPLESAQSLPPVTAEPAAPPPAVPPGAGEPMPAAGRSKPVAPAPGRLAPAAGKQVPSATSAQPPAARSDVLVARSSTGRLASRLPPPIGPLLARASNRLLFGIAGLAVAGVAIIVLMSARPTDVAATATTEPTELAPIPTESCPTPAAPLPLPSLVVTTPGAEPRRLGGIAAAETELDLESPWPASLGPVEASIPLGSTLQLTVSGACIAEWRAVAARPPVDAAEPWLPPAPETLQLGWQHADRIAWQPLVPLPARGEWIVRLTVWYRDAAGATSPSPAASTSGTGGGAWFVERYFRLVVEARDSS